MMNCIADDALEECGSLSVSLKPCEGTVGLFGQEF